MFGECLDCRASRYQARLIELQQKGGFGMQQIQALATEELLEEYIRNKCASTTCPSGFLILAIAHNPASNLATCHANQSACLQAIAVNWVGHAR